MHTTTYRRLTNEEREEISRSLARREKLTAIARRLHRSPSTISREVMQNSGKTGYRVYTAGRRAHEQFIAAGFTRVERDDRLLDVFPKETPEKGVELWEKWSGDFIEIIRIHNSKQTSYQFSEQSSNKLC